MAIVAGDLLLRLSVKTGAAGNSTGSTPAASLGKYISTTAWDQSTTLNNLFDDVSGVENEASDVEYRCVFILNNHATLTLQGTLVYIYSEVAGGTTLAIAVDSTAATAKGSASAQADDIADESTAPDPALTFSTAAVSLATGLSLGDIPAGYCRAVWIRRTAANTAAVSNDGGVLRFVGGTAA